MPQTIYRTLMPTAIEGAIADDGAIDVESRVNSGVSEIPFGRPVKAETIAAGVDKACLLAAASTDVPIGIAAHSHSYAVEELGTSGLKTYAMVNVLRKGRIRVKAGVTIADGQRLYYQTSTGKWVVAAVALDTIDMTAQVIARSSGVLNDLIVAEVDMTNKS